MTSDGSDNGPHGPDDPRPLDRAGEPDRPAQDRPFAPPPEPSSPVFPGPDPTAPLGSTEADAGTPPPRRGTIRNQDPESTTPRPPTVAEARARDKARRRAAEEEEAQQLADDKKRKRNRRLIGGAAVVGLVGVVALGYSALKPDEVTRGCVQEQNGQETVVEDKYCEEGEARGGGGGFGGLIFLGGNQYRYYYGGNQTIGQRPTGGTTTIPKGTSVKTKSGTTIQRGGLGSKIGGSSGS